MSELYYTYADEGSYDRLNKDLDAGNLNRGVAKQKWSVWVGDDSVKLTYSLMTMGVPSPNHRDKRYIKWDTIKSFGFKRLHTGTIMPYGAVREYPVKKGTYWRNISGQNAVDCLSAQDTIKSGECYAKYQEAMFNVFRVRDFADLYPAANLMNITRYMGMPFSMRFAYHERDVEHFCKALFGVTRYSPALERAVTQAAPNIISVARDMRGLTDTKNIIKFLENNPLDKENMGRYPASVSSIRKLFLAMPEKQVTGLAVTPLDTGDQKRLTIIQGHTPDFMSAQYYKNIAQVRRFSDLY